MRLLRTLGLNQKVFKGLLCTEILRAWLSPEGNLRRRLGIREGVDRQAETWLCGSRVLGGRNLLRLTELAQP